MYLYEVPHASQPRSPARLASSVSGRPLGRSMRTTFVSSALAMLLLAPAGSTRATTIDVALDTAGLSGQSGTVVFDLINTSAASSSLTISNFAGDFTANGSPSLQGDASGTIASGFLLSDSPDNLFFNEVAAPVNFGTAMGFTLDLSFGTPGSAEFPDELSVFLLTSDESASLITTDDPTGGDSILDYYVDATGTPNLTPYDATDTSGVTISAITQSVPEPDSLALMVVPLVGLLIGRQKALVVLRLPGKLTRSFHDWPLYRT